MIALVLVPISDIPFPPLYKFIAELGLFSIASFIAAGILYLMQQKEEESQKEWVTFWFLDMVKVSFILLISIMGIMYYIIMK